jgi:hypothetical protein
MHLGEIMKRRMASLDRSRSRRVYAEFRAIRAQFFPGKLINRAAGTAQSA